MLLLANYRPEYRPAWIGGSHCHRLALSPLGDAASRELLLDLLGTDRSLGDLPDRIHERTGGNPFFTEDVVQAWRRPGVSPGRAAAIA
jgi:predicted ATPase